MHGADVKHQEPWNTTKTPAPVSARAKQLTRTLPPHLAKPETIQFSGSPASFTAASSLLGPVQLLWHAPPKTLRGIFQTPNLAREPIRISLCAPPTSSAISSRPAADAPNATPHRASEAASCRAMSEPSLAAPPPPCQRRLSSPSKRSVQKCLPIARIVSNEDVFPQKNTLRTAKFLKQLWSLEQASLLRRRLHCLAAAQSPPKQRLESPWIAYSHSARSPVNLTREECRVSRQNRWLIAQSRRTGVHPANCHYPFRPSARPHARATKATFPHSSGQCYGHYRLIKALPHLDVLDTVSALATLDTLPHP